MSPSRFSQANLSCGAYKPVPPPKPFAGAQILAAHLHQQQQHQEQQQQQQQQQQQNQQQQHQQQQQQQEHQQHHHMEGNDPALAPHNGLPTYPHILVTEQGQFVTHSTKFPIGEESDKLVKRFNEANSAIGQGIDNPGLVSDSSMAVGSQVTSKEIPQNHYAQMRPYDPTKHPVPFIPNGHQQHYNRPQFAHSYQSQQAENSWQNHVQSNSVRFAVPPVNPSPDKKSYLTDNSHHNQNSQRPMYHSTQSSQPSHPQHNVIMRSNGCYDTTKNAYYQETGVNANDQSLKYSDMSGKVPPKANGAIGGGNHYGNNYILSNGGVNKQVSSHHEVNGVGPTHESNEDFENKKDDKWGSLKQAGKKYSQFKNILSNKFTKPETKLNSNEVSNSPLTQCKGTNSHDIPKNPETGSNGDALHSERLHNGENHLQENRNFQRVVTYSSLKTKLEGAPHQAYNPSMFMNPERHSGRTLPNQNGHFPANSSYSNQIINSGKQNGILGPKRAGSCSHLGAQASDFIQQQPSWGILHRSDDNLTRPLASDQSYPVHNPSKPTREGRVSGSSDSGRGTVGGSATEFKGHDTSLESGSSNRIPLHSHSSGNESEWIDIPETDGQQISFRGILHNRPKYPDGSRTPPLPPLSPEGSPKMGNRNSSRAKKQSNSFSSRTKKPDIVETTEQNGPKKSSRVPMADSGNQSNMSRPTNPPPKSKGGWNDRNPPPTITTAIRGREHGLNGTQNRFNEPQNRFHEQSRNRENEWRSYNPDKHYEDDELTSTDAALDLNSVLDGATEVTSDDDGASTRDGDSYLIRQQLEGLEGMYSEVLKVIGSRRNLRHADPRLLRRRTHGSVSSLPSSIMSSRAPRDRKGKVIDDRLRRASKDVSKTAHKRFQRLESHVVTLARSVAHLSSEMRTQHLMLQEIENIRSDLSSLKVSVKPSSAPNGRGGAFRGSRMWNASGPGFGGPSWSNPGRVKKLTQFFGDEPPLVRIFLRKLGYEKYATIFEQEKIGMLELPYMNEDRLQKIGIPLGPRLRILEEAQGPITTEGNLSVYVV